MSSLVMWIPSIVQASATLQDRRDARMNAQLLRDQARAEFQATALDEAQLRREARFRLGRQQAAQAESGISTVGSAGLLLDQSSVLAELDALNIRYGGQLRARGLLAESQAMRQRSRSMGLLAGAQLLAGASRASTQSRISGG